MKCADCKTDLQQLDFKGIKIEECPGCRGRWFDRGELSKAKDHVDEDLSWLDFDPFGEDANKFLVKSEEKSCPRCSVKMDSLTYEKSNVVINKCLVCHGIWVHHKEFKKIVDYLEGIVVSESSREYVKDSCKKFLEIFSGKEDVVSEMKNFLVIFKLLRLRVGVEHPEMAETLEKIHQYLPFL